MVKCGSSLTTLLLLTAAAAAALSSHKVDGFTSLRPHATKKTSLHYKSGEIDTKVKQQQPQPQQPVLTSEAHDLESPTLPTSSTTTRTMTDSNTPTGFVHNLVEGEAGERGEGYVAVQGLLMLCIIFGGIPIIGGSLMFLLGPGLFFVGALTMILAMNDMGSSLSPWPVPPSNGDLVTDGLFSKMRHPIYAGLLCNLVGLSIATGSIERLLLTGLLLYTLHKKTQFEEEQLQHKFPEYQDYAKRVPGKFLPHE